MKIKYLAAGFAVFLAATVLATGTAEAHTRDAGIECGYSWVHGQNFATNSKHQQDNLLVVNLNGAEVYRQKFGASVSWEDQNLDKSIANEVDYQFTAWDSSKYNFSGDMKVEPCSTTSTSATPSDTPTVTPTPTPTDTSTPPPSNTSSTSSSPPPTSSSSAVPPSSTSGSSVKPSHSSSKVIVKTSIGTAIQTRSLSSNSQLANTGSGSIGLKLWTVLALLILGVALLLIGALPRRTN